MRRGINFEIPNEYGSFLWEVLKPINITEFNWRIECEESYLVEEDKLGELLFLEVKLK